MADQAVSSDDWGFGSPLWLLRVALRAVPHSMLLLGLDHMLMYMDTHAKHVEEGHEDCEGPDLWTAMDLLIQVAATGHYVQTSDISEIVEPHYQVSSTKEEKLSDEDVEDLVKRFRDQMDGMFDEKGDADGDEDSSDSASR